MRQQLLRRLLLQHQHLLLQLHLMPRQHLLFQHRRLLPQLQNQLHLEDRFFH
jgi:hypothetical protein